MTHRTTGLARDTSELIECIEETRARILTLFDEIADEYLIGPKLEIVNPCLWEVGHVAWFYEKWVLRHCRCREPMTRGGDALYDSAAVHHPTRWRALLPERAETRDYFECVLDGVCRELEDAEPESEPVYFGQLGLFHADMHVEALVYTRQTLALRPPSFVGGRVPPSAKERAADSSIGVDVSLPGGSYSIGATRDAPFVFDNEKWVHRVEIEPFSISRCAVTQAQFAEFVADGGYSRPSLWSTAGWEWRTSARAKHPLYWSPAGGGAWCRRAFDQWRELEPELPVLNVNWFEAEAYCNWAARRLPTEAEWEVAAAWDEVGSMRRFPWGDEVADETRANVDLRVEGCVPVDARPDGDSAAGCRQLIGNVWEWTASAFEPYPGFVRDPYKEYSEPWFGDHRVLRGGSWATTGRMLRNTWRNFYLPERRDIWSGFRTCAR